MHYTKQNSLPPDNAHQIPYWQEPVQRNMSGNKGILFGAGQIHFRAKYNLTARVLGKKYYEDGKYGRIAPLDLALGWKYMAEPQIYKDMTFINDDRQYFFSGKASIPTQQVYLNSANVHIIPATEDVWKELVALKKENIVTLGGYLVDYNERTHSNSFVQTWEINTSLTRSDRGKDSCEIIYVTDIKIEQ
ncbi:MAG: hypothetical protein ACRBDL_04965 [Alphaproteobacteria bacterium]